MTPLNQQIAIAEACGWRKGVSASVSYTGLMWLRENANGPIDSCLVLPDYLNDLNSIHEAEKIIPKNLRGLYLLNLEVTTENAEKKAWPEVCATAAQRAKSLLITLGKWKD